MGLEPRIIPVSAAEAELAGPEAEICQFKVGKKANFANFVNSKSQKPLKPPLGGRNCHKVDTTN